MTACSTFLFDQIYLNAFVCKPVSCFAACRPPPIIITFMCILQVYSFLIFDLYRSFARPPDGERIECTGFAVFRSACFVWLLRYFSILLLNKWDRPVLPTIHPVYSGILHRDRTGFPFYRVEVPRRPDAFVTRSPKGHIPIGGLSVLRK